MEEKITIVMSRERPGRKSVPLKVVHHTDLIDGIMSKVGPILARLEAFEERESLLKDELGPLYDVYVALEDSDDYCNLIDARSILDKVFELLWQLGYVKRG